MGAGRSSGDMSGLARQFQESDRHGGGDQAGRTSCDCEPGACVRSDLGAAHGQPGSPLLVEYGLTPGSDGSEQDATRCMAP